MMMPCTIPLIPEDGGWVMDSMYYEKALQIKDGTPKDSQRAVFDHPNDGMTKVIEGSRKGSNVISRRIIHGPGFKMNAKLETCFYGFTRDWGVQSGSSPETRRVMDRSWTTRHPCSLRSMRARSSVISETSSRSVSCHAPMIRCLGWTASAPIRGSCRKRSRDSSVVASII